MKRKLYSLLTTGFVLSVAIFACGATARATLCSKCRDLMFIDSVGKCSECGGPTSSGALQICPKCSAKRHQCEHCRAALTEKDEAQAESRPADAADKPSPADSHADAGQEKPSSGWKAAGSGNSDSNSSGSIGSERGGNPVRPEEPAVATPSGPDIAPVPPAAANPETTVPPETLPEGKPPAEWQLKPILPEKLKPINPIKAGTYTARKWRYQLQIVSPGTRSEGRWGWLTYDGQKLPRGEINDYYNTPWGPVFWVDVPTTAWGLHGWMPVPQGQNRRQGRALTFPPSLLTSAQAQPGAVPSRLPPTTSGAAAPPRPRVQTLEINKSHNGQLARLHIGNMLVIRLPGNSASGYQWQAAATNSPALRLTVRPQYSPSASSTTPSTSGTYTFIFQAVQPGSGSIRLYYVRPNDPSRLRDVFAVGVNVAPVATARAAEPMANGGVIRGVT